MTNAYKVFLAVLFCCSTIHADTITVSNDLLPPNRDVIDLTLYDTPTADTITVSGDLLHLTLYDPRTPFDLPQIVDISIFSPDTGCRYGGCHNKNIYSDFFCPGPGAFGLCSGWIVFYSPFLTTIDLFSDIPNNYLSYYLAPKYLDPVSTPERGGDPVSTPEPSVWLLLLLGIGVFVLVYWNDKRPRRGYLIKRTISLNGKGIYR